MLFRKKIDKSCTYCVHGTLLDSGQVLCAKKGICASRTKCRKFCYDPLKRVPVKPKAPDFEKYDQDDFSL